MIFSSCILVGTFFLLLLKISSEFSDGCFRHLNVTNDGPVTLDVPITVTAEIACAAPNESYHFKFESDIGDVFNDIDSNGTAAVSFIFKEFPGLHVARVYAFMVQPMKVRIGFADTSFDVYEYLPGELSVLGSVSDKDGHEYIATGLNTSITLDIQYPRHVLKDTEFAYSWSIAEEKFSNDEPIVHYRFEEPGLKWIRVAVVARIPSYDKMNHIHYKWGHFHKEITVKNPFYKINISGNTYLEHGQLLNLDISCNGSGPVDYCWKIFSSSENQTNLTCVQPTASPQCSIPILYYFRNSGDFQLAIFISNLVSSLQRNVEVHIYDVSLRPQLSTVIIPLVCSILVIVIITVAIIIHMRRRTVTNIETADFDFMKVDDSNAVAIETSWEVMWRSLVHLLQLRCFCSSIERVDNVQYGTIMKER